MVVGKTKQNLSKNEIFSKISEAQVLSTVFPEVTSIPCLICSPLRSDNKPSFSIYMTNEGHVRFKDHACREEHGGLLDLLCKYWNCTLNQCLDKICSLVLDGNNNIVVNKQIRTLSRKEVNDNSKIQVTTRPWRDYDLKYWESYGITKKWLTYANIHPISHKIITKKLKDSKEEKYIFSADKYAYCFVEKKEGKTQLKIYQPFNTKGYKWCSKMDGSVIGLWTKIPQTGEKVVICSSLKDALVLSCQCGIPAICLQGEGYSMSDTAVNELKRRFDKVFICFDTDEPGIADSKKLAEQTGFTNVIPDLGENKDLSDYYKALTNKEDFKKLKQLFN